MSVIERWAKIGSRLLFALAAIVAMPAMAHEAVVNTIVCAPVPPGAAVVLTPVDDSPHYMDVADRLAKALRHAGYRIADSAALELRFQTTERGLQADATDRSLGELRGGGGGVSLNLNIWSSTKDSILGGRQTRHSGQYETHLILTMELDRAADGRCVWRGEARASLVDWRRSELAERLTGVLVDSFGKDVRLQRMTLE